MLQAWKCPPLGGCWLAEARPRVGVVVRTRKVKTASAFVLETYVSTPADRVVIKVIFVHSRSLKK